MPKQNIDIPELGIKSRKVWKHSIFYENSQIRNLTTDMNNQQLQEDG